MDRLRFPQKLLLMALIFVVPMLAVSALLIKSLSADITFASAELKGASSLRALADLQDAVQAHRGKLSLLLNH
ncbi:hypothetical protein ABTM64_21095, partial [Acinetobacter baumannii]